jgi:ABC-type Fe3+-hydroxamate transport system substrate-binding protein
MKFKGILLALSFVSLLALVASAQASAGETSQTTATWQTTTTWEMKITTSQTMPPPVDIIVPIEQFAISIARETFVYVLSTVIGLLIVVIITKGYQKWKDGSPSKTPSTMKPYP